MKKIFVSQSGGLAEPGDLWCQLSLGGRSSIVLFSGQRPEWDWDWITSFSWKRIVYMEEAEPAEEGDLHISEAAEPAYG